MKHIKIFTLIIAGLLAAVTSCKDDKELVPEWESAVHGLGGFAEGSSQNFVFQDPSVDLDLKLRWVSIDNKNAVEKIDLYVLFNEPFTDPDGNVVTAMHGGAQGLLFKTFTGSQVPSNRSDLNFSITPTEVYNLYKDATFDYDKNAATAPTPVFTNPDKPDRSTTDPFIKGDVFQLRWVFTAADGRVFDKWGVSVCTEFPGANCAVNWGVICASDLAGSYKLVSTWTTCTGDTGGGTYNAVTIGATANAGKYTIPDLSGGMEPEFWDNPPVAATIVDECGTIKLDLASFSYLYGYTIKSGSFVNPNNGVITINFENSYGEFGKLVFTPN